MSVESSKKKYKGIMGGLAFTIFMWFIVLSIGPVVFVGLNEYQTGKEIIVEDSYKRLSSVNFQLTQRVNGYFDTVLTNLFILADHSNMFISEIKNSQRFENYNTSELIKSREYQYIYDQYSEQYINFLKFYDYSDIIVGDNLGNILFTVNEYADYKENLFSGSLSKTTFAESVKSSLSDQRPKYSDLEFYAPIGEEVIFVISPVTNTQNESIGFIAIQILPKNIQVIFNKAGSHLSGISTFLVGTDRRVRFTSDMKKYNDHQFDEDNTIVNMWLENLGEDGTYFKSYSELDISDMDYHLNLKDITLDGNELGFMEFGRRLMGDDSISLDSELQLALLNDRRNNDIEFILQAAGKVSMSHIRSYIHDEKVLGTYLPVDIAGTPMMMLSEITEKKAFHSVTDFRNRLAILIALTFIIVALIALFVSRRLVKPIRVMNQWVNKVADGDYTEISKLRGSNEISELSNSFYEMTNRLRFVSDENNKKNWLQEGMAGLNNSLLGEQEITDLCNNIVNYIANYLDMHYGAMFIKINQNQLQLMGSYAGQKTNNHSKIFELGEGLVGQAALEKGIKEIKNIPDDYIAIGSGLGKSKPNSLVMISFHYEEELKGVLEFARFESLTTEQKLFLNHSVESIAIAIHSAQYRYRVNQLLDTTTKQSDALKKQQEELRSVNEQLESRAGILEESEEELKAQSEELQRSNAELEEISEQLKLQKEEIEKKNKDIELSSKKISEKAEELTKASKYKSEFLANMSHELRTPLNSLLLLSQMLATNSEGNLTEDQVQSAEVIYNGGKELLSLINDILDLSKVEAGKMSINLENVPCDEIKESLEVMFNPLAESKGLNFEVIKDSNASVYVYTDSQRLLQILKNFLSNAFKFTEEGSVKVKMFNIEKQGRFCEEVYVGFSVTDSGIGIPKEKQELIFGSFQQADGSTNRKYGGTGLGLAISKEMAELLGGFIELESQEGKGTTFTLFLPDNPVCALGPEKVLADNYHTSLAEQTTNDDENIKKAPQKIQNDPEQKASKERLGSEEFDHTLLIIEDDPNFVSILSQLASKHSFGCLSAFTGVQGIDLARKYKPSAIILDLGLPDMDGQEVLQQLKNDDATKHIPVHIVSGREPKSVSCQGSVGYLLKPASAQSIDNAFLTLEKAISETVRNVLILDLDEEQSRQVGSMLSKKGLHVGYADSVDSASQQLDSGRWDYLIMDIELGEVKGVDFLEKLREKHETDMPSVLIHTGQSIDQKELSRLHEFTNTMVIKGDRALERITDEVTLFLHTINSDDKEDVSDTVATSAQKSLEGHKILLVDDDLRNTFALSKALQGFGLEVLLADNGENAIKKLQEEEGIELVLMDIMMPVMDGYEATTTIRKMNGFQELPVIALTAKAMPGDKAKCLEAGANDYMSKPLDIDKLTEMLKVWLLR